MVFSLLKSFVVIVWTLLVSIVALLSLPVDRRGRFYYWLARVWATGILWVFGVKVHVRGLEHLDRTQRYVYVSNHASMFDIPAIVAGIPDRIAIILKEELARIPVWGWAMKYGHYISIDRFDPKDAMGGLEKAMNKVRGVASVLVFAEGTRSTDGKLQPFKRGAFAVAARSGVPIVPVTILNSFSILSKGSWRVRPADITVVVDKPVESAGTVGKEAELKLMQRVHAILEKNFVGQDEARHVGDVAGR
jgi:1-acyl-sn-glycerol-3-phosphate acyltransferase